MIESAKTPRYVSRYRSHAKLFAVEAQLAAYSLFRGRVPGCENRFALAVSERGRIEAYLDHDERRAAREVGWRVVVAPELLAVFVRDARLSAERYVELCRARLPATVHTLEPAQLASIVEELFNLQAHCLAYYNLSGAECIAGVEDHLLTALKKSHGDRAATIMQQLVVPRTDELATIREQRVWKEIVAAVTGGALSADALDERLRDHISQYGFLGAGGGHPQGWSLAYLRDRLEVDSSNVRGNGQPPVAREPEPDAGDPIDVGSELRSLATGLATLATNRLAMREAVIGGAHYSNAFFQALYRHACSAPEASEEVLRQLSVRDVLTTMRAGRKVAVEQLEQRFERYVLELRDHEISLLAGRDAALKIAELRFVQASALLSGRCAHAGGPVVGTVRVIDSGDHSSAQDEAAKSMEPGDILVTGMTHPKMIVACKKAAAIVTDEGGVTCHAAIIARELDIPCVVGTQSATSLLKTGDRVRVDSLHGTVALLDGDASASDAAAAKDDAPSPQAPRTRSHAGGHTRAQPARSSSHSGELIVSLSASRARHGAEVGEKAAGLMAIFDLADVPRGFVVTTSAFRAFMASVMGRADWSRSLPCATEADDHAAGETIRAAIAREPLPETLRTALTDAYLQLDGASVAVRSSATTEDTKLASAAGQHTTSLCVGNPEQLEREIRACYASLFGTGALSYRRHHGLPLLDAEMAVIVQRMVPARCSGVMFTVNPVGIEQELIIEGAYGYGTAVVDGLVTPDMFTVDRTAMTLARVAIGTKTQMACAADGGGLALAAVEPERRRQACLTGDVVLELARTGVRLEQALGSPLDIEWAVTSEHRIHVLQARPITALTH